ncbi:MAG: pro-sigmaK processing inhibitor BofA family protein [Selenomonas sp.]|nr:pro-sigmaK processing inhibitor BofA family protein [Selenomonas sp.]
MEIIVAFAVGIIVLALLAKIVTMPLHLVWKLVTNSIIGAVMLWGVNLFGAGVNITIFKALVAGVFGVPGVIGVLLYQYVG